ncbi:MAG: hypothetical protein DHS20C01_20090 [marine bacterium B5-7]|nr:MAG: hypothetical protein DHS20C01_20090 [marine bacterium B5-7]
MSASLSPAPLDTTALNEIKHLEEEIGSVVVALEPMPAYANLDNDQLQRLRETEQRLGVVMVAYDS